MITRRRLQTAGVLVVALLLGACGYGVTGNVSDVGAASATLTGVADATEPGDITYWFEYGTSESYGLSTATQTASITGPIPVQAVVTGLATNATYHYRLCVKLGELGVCGADQTFATGTSAFTVNHTGDAPDSHPGNGICQDKDAAIGRCSLRAAVQEANGRNGSDTVTVQPGLGTIALSGGELSVSADLTVQGNGATITALGASRVVNVTGGQLTLQRATLTGGRAPTGGGLAVAPGATANVFDSTVSGNESTGLYTCSTYFSGVSPGIIVSCDGVGGGAGVFSDGTLNISRSTVSGNHSVGGGCVTQPNPFGVGTLVSCSWAEGAGVRSTGGAVVDSTISGNSADAGSGNGLSAAVGPVSVTRSTIVGNSGGAPTQVGVCCGAQGHGLPINGTIVVQGSIVAGAAPICSGTPGVSSSGYNVVSGSSCGTLQSSDQHDVNPTLGPLTDNGGPTRTHLPYANSPAVDAIPVGTPGLCSGTALRDQRGVSRPDGAACDAGAVEGDSGTTPGPLDLVVNHGGEGTDATPGDGVCQDTGKPSGTCSLRAAIGEANARPGPDSIEISAAVNIVSVTSGGLAISDDVTLDGDGVVIDAGGVGTVLTVVDADLHLSDATIARGGSGGIRYVADGHTLRLSDVTVRDSAATQGGGIYIGGGQATIERSTISGNTSAMEGGGIYVRMASLTLVDSTVSGNQTTATSSIPSKGGGLYLVYGSMHVTRSTVAGNTTPVWGAIHAEGAETEITLTGSAVANPGTDCGGVVESGGYNRAEDTTCFLSGPGDQQGVPLSLGALAANGGSTRTHLPAAGSPVLDAIPGGTVGLCPATGTTDQRGVSRPQGPGCDAGAVEVAIAP